MEEVVVVALGLINIDFQVESVDLDLALNLALLLELLVVSLHTALVEQMPDSFEAARSRSLVLQLNGQS